MDGEGAGGGEAERGVGKGKEELGRPKVFNVNTLKIQTNTSIQLTRTDIFPGMAFS